MKLLPAQNGPCNCPDPNDVTYIGTSSSSTTKLSDLNFTNGVPPTGCLSIVGTFVIDELFTASNTTFVMQPGSKIVISYPGGSGDINLSNNNFYSCQNMWQGITVKNSSSLVFENNSIEDAQYAITARQNTTLRIVNNTFHKDWVGIFINPDGGSVSIPKGFYNNHFTCGNDNLLPPYTGQSPDPGDKTFAGVYILNASYFTVGKPNDPTSVNYMDGIRNGIIAHQATVGVYYQDIQNLIGSSNPGNASIPSLNGVAIYGKECPEVRAQHNNMQNSYVAIYTSFSNIKAKNNIIHTNHQGIFAEKASNKYIEVMDNDITLSAAYPPPVKSGILIKEANNYHYLDVSSNNIHVLDIGSQSYLGQGIYIAQSYPGSGTTTNQISNNNIDLQDGGYGIIVLSSKGIPVFSNFIQYSFAENFDYHFGIHVGNSHDCRIRDNTLIGFNPLNALPRIGIQVSYSPSTLLCCNDLDEFHTAVEINGNCNNSRIATTQLHTHYYGIYYNFTGLTGDQYYTGNEWHEDCYDADLKTTIDVYTVDPSQQPNDGGILIISPGPAPNCSTWPTCGEEWPYPALTALDSSIASGSLGNLPYSTYTTWMTEQALYAKLSENNSLWQLNSLMNNFKTERDTQDIGLLYPVRLATDTAWQYDPALDQQMQTLYVQITAKANEIDSLYEVFPGNNAADSLAILQQINLLQSEIQNLKTTWWQNDSTFVQNLLANTLPQIASDNQNLQVSFQPAVNERDFNSYLLQYWQNENALDSAALSNVYALASQCHYTGGTAVLRARRLYEFTRDTLIDWDAIEICKTSKKGKGKPQSQQITYAKIKVFPNPANTFVNLQIPKKILKTSKEFHYELTDMQGQLWLSGNTSAEIQEIKTSHLAQGVYVITLTSKEGKLMAREKITVLH